MRRRIFVLVLFLSICILASFSGASKEETNEYNYSYDFESEYDDGIFAVEGLTIKDGKLIGSKKAFLFGSNYRLGDDYGLIAGKAKVKVSLLKGKFLIGLRTINKDALASEKGIWFTFDDTSVSIKVRYGNLDAKIDHGLDFSKETLLVIEDIGSEIKLSSKDKAIFSISFNGDDLVIKDGDGKIHLEGKSKDLAWVGYIRIGALDNFSGTIDDFSYNHYILDSGLGKGEKRNINYGNWVAADDLLREVNNKNIPKPRKDKYVGIFYFISFDQTRGGIYDHTKTYVEEGLDGLWKQLRSGPIGYGRYWAEPYFGYYLNGDTWVYRKHAYQLVAAGVDFVFLDMSNGLTYPDAHIPLFDTWLKIREEGGSTPDIVCFTGDRGEIFVKDLYVLYENIFKHEKYDDLHFKWEGKPLILGNFDKAMSGETELLIGQTKNNDLINFYAKSFEDILAGFTIRKSWAWRDEIGHWNWLMESPQKLGTDLNGKFEQMSVAMGHHASTSKGRSYVNGVKINNGKNDFEFSSDTARYGLGFESQFKYAIEKDPRVIMITGWNEWTAGKWPPEQANQTTGNTPTDFVFVDQFNPEFSRDGEPMKLRDGVGFGDNFYYQMSSYIRLFKGMEEGDLATGQKKMSLNGSLSQWDKVGPEYRDTIGDTQYRSHGSFGGEYHYLNTSGRNDIDYAKVSVTDDYIYFLVACINKIILDDGENWTNLFINIDGDYTTGFEGYDFILNRSRDGKKLSVERFVDNSWAFEKIGEAEYLVKDNYLVLKLATSLVSDAKVKTFDFKWADNSTKDGNILEFMDLGDVAPNDRFNFRYVYGSSGSIVFNYMNLLLILSVVIFVLAIGILVWVLVKDKKKA